MTNKRQTATITTNTDTFLGVCGDGSATIKVNGTFDGATVTLKYLKEDGTLASFNDTDATQTSNFEVNGLFGAGTKIYLGTSGGGVSLDIDAVMTSLDQRN